MFDYIWNIQVLMQFQITGILRCAHNYTQTLVLNNLEPPDMDVGRMPPNWAGIIHIRKYLYSINLFLMDNLLHLLRSGPINPRLWDVLSLFWSM